MALCKTQLTNQTPTKRPKGRVLDSIILTAPHECCRKEIPSILCIPSNFQVPQQLIDSEKSLLNWLIKSSHFVICVVLTLQKNYRNYVLKQRYQVPSHGTEDSMASVTDHFAPQMKNHIYSPL